MNKRTYTILSVAAIAVMGGALFGSTFTAQLNAVAFDVSGANALQKIEETVSYTHLTLPTICSV